MRTKMQRGAPDKSAFSMASELGSAISRFWGPTKNNKFFVAQRDPFSVWKSARGKSYGVKRPFSEASSLAGSVGNESALPREGRSAGFTPAGTLSIQSPISRSAAIAHRAYTRRRAPGTLDAPVVSAAKAALLLTKRMARFPASCSLS